MLIGKTLHDILCDKRRKKLLRRLMGIKSVKLCKLNNSSIELALFKLFNSHCYSCDKNDCPNKYCALPPLRQNDMLNEFMSHDFYYASRFWQDQFHEIIDSMELILDKTVNKKYGICCEDKVNLFSYLEDGANLGVSRNLDFSYVGTNN